MLEPPKKVSYKQVCTFLLLGYVEWTRMLALVSMKMKTFTLRIGCAQPLSYKLTKLRAIKVKIGPCPGWLHFGNCKCSLDPHHGRPQGLCWGRLWAVASKAFKAWLASVPLYHWAAGEAGPQNWLSWGNVRGRRKDRGQKSWIRWIN